jgi:protein TonB
VLEGEPATPQDDVYSLACVAYRMLAGRRALGNDDALAAEAAGRYPLRARNMSDPQWLALQHALEFRRAARTNDVATFLREFDAPARTAVAQPNAGVRAPGLRFAVAAGVVALAFAFFLWTAPEPATAPGTVAVRPPLPAPAVHPEPALPPVAPPPAEAAPPAGASPAPTPAPPKTVDAAGPPTKKRPTPPANKPARAAVAPQLAAATPAEPSPVADAAPAGSPPDPPAAGEAANAPGALVEVPLSALKFRRFVEPAVRRRRRDDDSPGWVELRFIVGVDGRTHDTEVTSSSPAGRDDAAALAAIARWRFEPPMENGHAVERRSSVRLRFEPE